MGDIFKTSKDKIIESFTKDGNYNDQTTLRELELVIEGYFCLIENFNDYMNLCLVYQEVQASLLNDSSSGNMVIINWNAIILVQGLHFIENGERFSHQDHKFKGERHKKLQKHKLDFTGFGIDDFIYEEARVTPIFRWIKTTFRKNKMVKLLEHNVDRISDIIN